MEGQPTNFEPVPMDSEDDFFIVYTSGTTNNPRRIVHSQAGYLLYAAFTRKVCMYLIVSFSHFIKTSNSNLNFIVCTNILGR